MSFTGSNISLDAGGATVAVRVLLDVLDPVQRRALPDDSPLRFYQEAVLLQVLDEEREPVGLSFFAGRDALETGQWAVESRRPVRVEELEFPIFLKAHRREIHLIRGEVSLLTDISYQEFRKLRVLGTQFPSGVVPQLACAVRGLPLPGGESPELLLEDLETSDLRRHEDGSRVLQAVGRGIEEPYADFACKHGFEPARLLPA